MSEEIRSMECPACDASDSDCILCDGDGEINVFFDTITERPLNCPDCGGDRCEACKFTGLEIAS
jgi:hypothetical protein